jgi:hypothetical protein
MEDRQEEDAEEDEAAKGSVNMAVLSLEELELRERMEALEVEVVVRWSRAWMGL